MGSWVGKWPSPMARRFFSGQQVRIDSHVQTIPDPQVEALGQGDPDGNVDLHGEHGSVIASNPVYKDAATGEVRVAVALDNGFIAGVPAKALRPSRRTAVYGVGDRYDEIFGCSREPAPGDKYQS